MKPNIISEEEANRRSGEAAERYAAMPDRERDLHFSFEFMGWAKACTNAGIPLGETLERAFDLLKLLKERNREHFTRATEPYFLKAYDDDYGHNPPG